MNIAFVEIQNFRKLKSCRIDFSEKSTVFVGANNSGKTSAMLALKKFLQNKQIPLEDFTISNWSKINSIGEKYITNDGTEQITIDDWIDILPALDVWLDVRPDEIRYVAKIIPTLNWNGGKIGVRLIYEPKNIEKLFTAYRQAYNSAREKAATLKMWPVDFCDFFSQKLSSFFKLNYYILDDTKLQVPSEDNIAHPQNTPYNTEPLDFAPFDNLIKIDIIPAHRGLDDTDVSDKDKASLSSSLLSSQLREYYDKQLDPERLPTSSDIKALAEIQSAKDVFNKQISKKFQKALKELATFGYPGRNNPNIIIETHAKTSDMLSHNTVVRYPLFNDGINEYKLPEKFNGLGYQNLITMSFRLMSFRDEWINGNEIIKDDEESSKPIPPLHLVLIEEPEAHLHAQVQQVFIKGAYKILRNHPKLKTKNDYSTQMIITTHSSYIAHETNFAELRYFKRIQGDDTLPITAIANLSDVFGEESDATAKFVTRYLKTTHCDLFFADAVILLEGAAEKILLPHFIENGFPTLAQSYISILEISGSHAHRLKALIERLGLLCVIITDLDTINATTKKSAIPSRGIGLISGNTTVREWIPAKEKVDDLLDLDFDKKVIEYSTTKNSFIRVAYQTPLKVVFSNNREFEMIPTTFEDALVYQNFKVFKSLKGLGLIKKFKKAIKTEDCAKIQEEVFKILNEKNVKKAEFALELLYVKDPKNIKPPQYIYEALQWLQVQLESKDNRDFLEMEE